MAVQVFLKPGKEVPVLRFHPWIFSGAIARVDGKPEDGDIAEVYDRSRNLLGVGHFHHGSIAVRLLSFGPAEVTERAFWTQKILQARAVRKTALHAGMSTECYRLVHGEGDGLSGLVVDIYGPVAVMQCHSIGMHRQRALIAEALREAFGADLQAIYDKSYEALPPKYAESQQNGFLWTATDTPPEDLVVHENEVAFRVNWVTGQKTGFFLDQRDNRQLLSRFVAGKTVLNTFCYTGGFSCYALRAGATLVHSVDVSAKAMELTAQNVELNRPFTGEHEGFTEDVLRFLKNDDRSYEVMIVDPPAYAKSIEKRHNAVQGYKRLNEAALRRVAPGGILFTFSCSQVIDRELFYHTIAAAAMEVGRSVRVLHHLTQGADHPVSLFHPEGSYLKGLVLFVE
ncbi:MAG TPA: class I SAM-dependent rRNA methyltransferase [Saprospiraceae bacterium]|nr:class I SAM-dependent rRNA methyltransferase [Saprospiraceae bacterium]